MSASPIVVEHLNHAFGEAELRRQVLFDISTEIRAGEIVILTGPSGSGKTTLLTLVGALRSAQDGSLRVLGHELRGAGEATLAGIRQRIGYVFQAHNLLEALTARQNVRMSLELDQELPGEELDRRATEALEWVGLGDRGDDHPSRLSGGQRQRVAIARALARRPEILLADEPTASLDRETGRGIVELMQQLARKEGVTVVLVTHDNRVLDIADRILSLEDGRLTSLMSAVTGDAQHMLRLVAQDVRRGELARRVEPLGPAEFGELLDQVTGETRQLLDIVDVVQSEAFGSMLEQVVGTFVGKVAEAVGAERATLLFVDDDTALRWSSDAAVGETLELPALLDRGIAGHVVSTGEVTNVTDVSADPRFDPSVDAEPTNEPRALLAIPIVDSQAHVFAVVEVADPLGGHPFGPDEERRLRDLTSSLGVILESWWRMSCSCRAAGVGRTCPCCGSSWHATSRPSEGPPAT